MSGSRIVGSGLLLVGLLVVGVWLGSTSAEEKKAEKKANTKVDSAALKRAREHVQLLDDLYKTHVVVVTKTYVEQQADTPAATVAKLVFEAMHKKGHHTAQLLDVTGHPKNKENVAKTPFEKKACKEIATGKASYEEIDEVGGKPVLRVATIVPSVMKQCAICHGGKEGRPLGAIVYEVPIK